MGESNLVADLRDIIDSQMTLLNFTLYIATQGPADFAGQRFECNLSELKMKTSQNIALGAGQSVSTILKCAEWKGIPVRDLYPIARSAVESFINAAFLLVSSEEVAGRAARYVSYASWKQSNRTVGSGEFTLKLSTSPLKERATSPAFPEFSGRGNGEWTKLDLPSRLRCVGELAGKRSGGRLLAAYTLIYSISSEIIHGSPFGMNYFYQAHLPENPTVDDFREGSSKHVESILIAIAHAAAGYLSAFFAFHNMAPPQRAEQELFNRLLAIDGVEPQSMPNE